jgi:hypothetical protein
MFSVFRVFRGPSAAMLLLAIHCQGAWAASSPVLSNPTLTGGQFQFELTGDPNLSYAIGFSTDLRTWTTVLTNREPQATRLITLPAPASVGFWRVSSPLFLNAIAARGTVTLGGSGWVDSFDSADPASSTDGRYDPIKRTDRAEIVSITNATVNVGNMQVAGVVRTGPGGTVTVSPNGGVGSIPYLINPAYDGTIEPGHFRDDEMNLIFTDAHLPNAFGPVQAIGPGIVGGTVYNYVAGSGDYRIAGNFNLGSGQMIVTGRARIYITGSTTVSGSGSITVATNASVEWYAGGNVNIGGSGIVNVGWLANSFSLIGLRTSTSVSYSGTSPFIGTIYAPTADVTMSGSSSNSAIGAVAGRTVMLSGGLSFHFDENLKRAGPFF